MQYFTDKVVRVNGALYTSISKVQNLLDQRENIVVLRKVERTVKKYTHPLGNELSVCSYDKVQYQPEFFISESHWNSLEDENLEKVKVNC